jgi:hypothetical protein
LIKALDGDKLLGEVDFAWEENQNYILKLAADGNVIRGWINGKLLMENVDNDRPLEGGATAFIVVQGTLN